MAIIKRKSKDGFRYQVKVKGLDGSWLPTATFSTKKRAISYEAYLKGELASESIQGRMMLFSSFWKQWAEECRFKVTIGWRTSQDQMARDYILPVLDDIPLGQIKPQNIGKLMTEASRKGIGPATQRHVYNLVHKVFEDAIEHYELIEKNPVLKRYRPRVPKTERQFLKPVESQKLLEFCRDHQIGPAIWLQLFTGMRPCEVQGLRKKAIDFTNARIVIKEIYSRKSKALQPYTKQKDWGSVPIPPVLLSYLSEKTHWMSDESFVVQGVSGGMLPYDYYHKWLKRVCSEAGVLKVTPHELRHSCTELYVEVGASQEDIRRLLNHSSLSSTAGYIHRTHERLQQIASRVGIDSYKPDGTPTLRIVKA